jgi:hypothetical protein
MCSCLLSLFLIILRAIHCGYVKEDSSDAETPKAVSTDAEELGTSDAPNEDEDRFRFLGTYDIQAECTGYQQSMAVLVLLIVSIVFLIFTCCMLFEQIEAIETNSSKIARMKMRVGQAGTELSRVTEEFNEMFGGEKNEVEWHWFLPLRVDFPRGMQKVVLGYEWDETFDPVPYEERNGDEEGGNGKIELTTTAGVPNLPLTAVAAASPLSSSPEEGEEENFSGTPVVADQPTLTKRANSRGPDGRARLKTGTLT